ncbi:MAG TPA: ABC transporter permease [Gemmatimonadaceae bacterium]
MNTPDSHAPPPLAEWLVTSAVERSAYGDEIVGDLREEFVRGAATSAPLARRRYWRRALSIGWRFLPSRLLSPRRTSTPSGDAAMSTFTNDLRFAVRTLRRAPSFTIAAILALGLGTGSTAGVYSLLRGVVLRPLPYSQPDRLVTLWETNQGKSLTHEPISPVNFTDYRGLTGVFSDAAAWWRPQINLTDDSGEPVRVNAIETTDNIFSVLGVRPLIGSDFVRHPQLYGTEHQAIISHRLWESRFSGARDVVGKVVHLNGYNYTVVGVMPPDFSFPGQTDLWEQMTWDVAQHSRFAHFMESVARVKPGVTTDQAQRELTALATRLGTENKASNGGWGVRVITLDHEVAGAFRPALYALFGASMLLLLIACINVANLLLARAVARRREVAVRAAIGASRPRLIRLFLTESLVLAAVGSAIGLVIAVASVNGLLAWSPVQIPRAGSIGVDVSVLIFATVVAAFTAIGFGLVPAVFMSRAELQDALKDGAKGAGTRGRKLRSGLVVAEVALAVMLLSGAGLLIRSVEKLLDVNAGVDPTSSIAVDLQLPDAAYSDWNRVDQFYTSLAQSLRASPEIASVGAANFLPLEVGWRIAYQATDHPVADIDQPQAQFHIADEGYFSTLRVPLISGRSFIAQDDAHSVPVVVVNEALARQMWPGQTAVGKHISSTVTLIGPLSRRLVPGTDYEVIGVAHDIKNSSLRSAAEPAVYFTERQFPSRKMFLIARGPGDPARLAALVRDEVRRLDPTLALGDVKPMDRVLSESVDPPRFVMLLMIVFAALALTLAAVGIYGILTFAVSHRRREIGIRLALGAQPAAMLRMIVREGVGLALVGCAIGGVGAFIVGRSLSGFLFDVPAWDPVTLGGVLAVVIVVATAACLMPGRRAAAADPASALRAE